MKMYISYSSKLYSKLRHIKNPICTRLYKNLIQGKSKFRYAKNDIVILTRYDNVSLENIKAMNFEVY